MASDNTKLNIASQDGGDSIRTILKTAAKTQVVTLDVGGSGAESLISGTVPVSGTVSANATLAAETTKVIGTVNVAASQTIAVTQATASNLNAQVVGTVASGATDSGNPVKVGGVYNSTLPTLTTGQRGDVQVSAKGVTLVSLTNNTGDLGAYNTVSADGQSGSIWTLVTAPRNYIFNGSTWDRQRGDTTGTYVVDVASTVGGASFLNIAAGQATTVVKASAGKLYSITINSAATATNTTIVYDNASGAGTVIGRLAATAVTAPVTINYGPAGLAFANGLTIITATANGGDMTIVFK